MMPDSVQEGPGRATTLAGSPPASRKASHQSNPIAGNGTNLRVRHTQTGLFHRRPAKEPTAMRD
jgi:hypothetical protein